MKRILATSDALTGTILSTIATELESGQLVILGTEPWLHLHYGIVSLKGRPWTQAAERFREFVLQAEREATDEEQRLVTRFGRRRAPARGKRAARTRRGSAGR